MHELNQQTPFLVFTNIFLIAFLCIYLKDGFRYGYVSPKKQGVAILLSFIFCLIPFWGTDWFGYLLYFRQAKGGLAEYIAMEKFYVWLMKDVCTGYFQFRAIVWGGALFFFIKILKYIKANVGVVLFFFCSIYLIYFSYARATLAIAMMSYGYVLLWTNNKIKSIINVFWGLGLIFSSFFFHKSAIIGIIAVFISIIVKKWGKKGIILSMLLFPFALLLLIAFFRDSFAGIADSDDTIGQYAQAGSSYLAKEEEVRGLGAFVQVVLLERIPYYLLAYCAFQELWKPSAKHGSMIESCFILLFVEVLTASLFLFDLGVNTSAVYGRFLRFAQIPACIVLAYLYQQRFQTKLVKCSYILGMLGCAYALLYTFYNQFTKM